MGRTTLDRAREGDAEAFAQITAAYRRELHLHCYRMLGSVVDADDVLQETLTAAWRGLAGLGDPTSLRAWLYRIATNRCLNAIRSTKRRKPPEPLPPFEAPDPSRRAEVTWLQPYPDAWFGDATDHSAGPETRYLRRETVELAFVTALQRLPPRQTAVVVLCDVVGFSTGEVAAMLGTTPTAVKGLRQRARAALAGSEGLAAHRGAPSSVPGSSEERRVARRFADAFIAGDIGGVVALLTDDAWLAMPPAPHVYQGRGAVAAFLRASTEWRGTRVLELVPTRANSQPAFACYLSEPDGSRPSPAGLIVLTVEGGHGGHIRAITRFLDADLQRGVGLPQPTLPDSLLDQPRLAAPES